MIFFFFLSISYRFEIAIIVNVIYTCQIHQNVLLVLVALGGNKLLKSSTWAFPAIVVLKKKKKKKHVLETKGHKKNPGGINMESSCNVKYSSEEGDVAPAWTKVKDKVWREFL